MTALLLTGVGKSYDGVETIGSIDLEVAKGELVVLVGSSGCGKSTLLRMIAGLEDVTAGTIHIDGADVTHIPAADRGVAMVFQSYALYPHMSVRENLSFGLRNMRVPRDQIAAQIAHAASILELDGLLERMPHQLSGGQRQRVAIGRAIVRDPTIFLFDEPLSNLDADLRVRMRHEIAQLHKRLGRTMIYVTHDQVEAMTLADRLIILDAGRISQAGTPLEIYERPANIFTAGFIGSPRINLFDAVVTTRTDGTATFEMSGGISFSRQHVGALSSGDRVKLGLRPEHVFIAPRDDWVALTLQVEAVEALGHSTFIYGAVPEVGEFRAKLDGHHPVPIAQQLTLHADPERFLLFDAAGQAILTTTG